ncbi:MULTISPECIES: HVO_0758 family zinc finger protein [Haloarcula]|jgi:NAD-dependent SIR2 family protein deacetylase|uniref:HVO_0758 family zinc finger protein n=1 Tax=Haloarcula TaxID=2237 RepID=UPI0023E3B529|nr:MULTISPECIES: HVO_0758 family zinc finger protein [Haloarculaceae]
MDSVRKALRAGDVEKDNYGRLSCTACEETLTTDNNPDDIGKVRRCPECGSEWKELG